MSSTAVETSYQPSLATPTQLRSPASSNERDGNWQASKNSSARLLYRGALSLPDSELLLDGLTFVLKTPFDDSKASRMLLESPLPLALESMRGRPSLSFVGVVRMDDVYCDFNEVVNVHIHPRCVLTHQLFAHNLCATPVDPSKGRTDKAIRIRLGDATVPATDSGEIVVYGRPHPSSSVMQLCVARIIPRPPAENRQSDSKRPPRPDDPTPRKPPTTVAAVTRIGLGTKRLQQNLKGKEKEKEKEKAEAEGKNGHESAAGPSKKPRKGVEMSAINKNARAGSKSDVSIFKVPLLPTSKGKGKATASNSHINEDPDVFEIPSQNISEGTSDTEAQNKLFIKKTAVRLVNAVGIGKQHPDFKEYFNHVYRGVLFALRSKMKSQLLEMNPKDAELVDRIVQAHVTLYQGGKGLGVCMLQS